MAVTYEPIATTTLGTAAASITFSSIASTWTDLLLIYSGKVTAVCSSQIIFNGATTNYTNAAMYAYSSVLGKNNFANSSSIYMGGSLTFGSSTTAFAMGRAEIFSYASTTINKSVLVSTGSDISASTGGEVSQLAGCWHSTAAITSLSITNDGSTTFQVGTTATLYGIKAA